MEHFVTLFDSHYLPQALCLHRSLERHGRPFRLWTVALDEACAAALERIGLSDTTILRLSELENDALRSVKASRSVGEYCWTLTPFLPSFVFRRAPGIERVTYVDADVYFFQPPSMLLDELQRSGKHILITEHAFAPEYASHVRYGRFCVQFVTFRNTEPAKGVLAWWQDRCIEWCYAREEDGKFGDQKYLDRWPEMFPQAVHVLSRSDWTAAPWNVAHISRVHGAARPVLYHFHGLKVVSRSKVVLYCMYAIGGNNRWIYDEYVGAIRAAARTMRRLGIAIVGRPLPGRMWGIGTFLRAMARGQVDWASF